MINQHKYRAKNTGYAYLYLVNPVSVGDTNEAKYNIARTISSRKYFFQYLYVCLKGLCFLHHFLSYVKGNFSTTNGSFLSNIVCSLYHINSIYVKHNSDCVKHNIDCVKHIAIV